VKKGEMMSIEDIIDLLAISLIGVVPDDESIIVTSNKGEPAAMDDRTKSGLAYRNVAGRMCGEQIPLMDLDTEGFFKKFKKLFSKKS